MTLRARFPNPQSILLPGMFVTAPFAQAIDTSAFLVPQAGVSSAIRKGNATVWVVGPGNKSRSAGGCHRSHPEAPLGHHAGSGAGREGHHSGHREP